VKTLKRWIPLGLVAAILLGAALIGPSVVERVAYAVERAKQGAVRQELAELSEHDQLSALFRAVAKAIKPAVVEVRVVRRIEQPRIEDFFGPDFPLPERFRPPGSTPERSRPRRRRSIPLRGLGSGVIVDAEKGYVLTAFHVVGKADEVEVVLAGGRKFQAQWVRSDPQSDIAMIKIAPDRLVAAPLGDSDEAQVGDWVLAIGAPKGLPQTVTAGIISAKGRHSRGLGHLYQDFIQTDAAINKGNSGGPLVNMRGEVIGLNNSIVTSSGLSGNEGIGFAIPSNMARDILNQLIDKGKVVRGYLGILPQDVDEALVESLGLPNSRGALVAMIVPDSAADKGGLKIEDVIVSINGRETPNANQLRLVVASLRPGQTVPVVIYRDGQKKTLRVTLEARPQELAGDGRIPEGARKAAGKFGLRVATMTKDLAEKYGYEKPVEGVVITEVEEGSDAAEQGLAEGIVITHVEGRAVKTGEDFDKAIRAKRPSPGIRLRVISPTGGAKIILLEPSKS